MNKQQLNEAIQNLGRQGKLYCNEGDFVYSVGKEVQLPVRFEYPIPYSRQRIDMVAFDNGQKTPCEFKHSVKACTIPCEFERLALRGSSGQNEIITEFINDVVKMENYLLATENSSVAFVVLLTNDTFFFHDLFTTTYKHSAQKPLGSYKTDWVPYCKFEQENFQYTIVEIRKENIKR